MSIDTVWQENRALEAEIERLRDCVNEMGHVIEGSGKAVLFRTGHHITHEQIAAAWEYLNNCGPKIKAPLEHMLAVFFDIFRCEGCDGSGRFEAVGLYEDCDECDGKGYVIKEVNDGT